MDSGGRLFFNSSCEGNMLFLGSGDPVFRGNSIVFFFNLSSYCTFDSDTGRKSSISNIYIYFLDSTVDHLKLLNV